MNIQIIIEFIIKIIACILVVNLAFLHREHYKLSKYRFIWYLQLLSPGLMLFAALCLIYYV